MTLGIIAVLASGLTMLPIADGRLSLSTDRAPAVSARLSPRTSRSRVVVPRVVKPGDKVTATVRTSGVVVSATLDAVDGGAVGDTIRVANKLARRVMRAIVIGPGQVEVIHER